MEMMYCPVCGKVFDPVFVQFLDNGNSACPQCVVGEQERDCKK